MSDINVPGGLREYINQDIYERSLTEPGQPTGPLRSPIKAPCQKPKTAEDALKMIAEIICDMKQMPYLISTIQDLLPQLIPPKGALPFRPGPGAPTSIAPIGQGSETWTTITSVTLDHGFDGYITNIGTQVFPDTAGADISWRLTVNGRPQPRMDALSYYANTTGAPVAIPWITIPTGSKVSIDATNAGSGTLYVNATLWGFVFPSRRF